MHVISQMQTQPNSIGNNSSFGYASKMKCRGDTSIEAAILVCIYKVNDRGEKKNGS